MKVHLTVAVEQVRARLTPEECKFKSTWPVIICILILQVFFLYICVV